MAYLPIHIIVVQIIALALQVNAADNNFNTYYTPNWGLDHVSVTPQGTQAKLQLDKSSGAGFKSKVSYGSGLFHIKMKLPNKKTGGVITTFYLTSLQDNQASSENHFELDLEFVGTTGKLSTNVYDNDSGHREQAFNLWFDPSQDFHNYDILWNPSQIVFFVDNIPLRVFKNNTAHGIAYPFRAMHIEGSIWDGSAWAGPVSWNLAPFEAYFQDFGFGGCPAPAGGDVSGCASPQQSWNQQPYLQLTAAQKQQMKEYRAKHLTYDYCTDPKNKKKECPLNAA